MSFLQICSFASVSFIQALTGRNSSCVVAGKNAVFSATAPLPFTHFLQLQCEKYRLLLLKGLYSGANAVSLCIAEFHSFPPQMFLF